MRLLDSSTKTFQAISTRASPVHRLIEKRQTRRFQPNAEVKDFSEDCFMPDLSEIKANLHRRLRWYGCESIAIGPARPINHRILLVWLLDKTGEPVGWVRVNRLKSILMAASSEVLDYLANRQQMTPTNRTTMAPPRDQICVAPPDDRLGNGGHRPCAQVAAGQASTPRDAGAPMH